jgi:sulfite reductase (NADPH) hemoprotein beta-component
MYVYDQVDQRLVEERVAQFRDQTRRFLDGKLSEGRVPGVALAQRSYIQALRADATHRHSLRPAVVAPAAQARASRARVRPRLRPFFDAPEPAAQLAAPGRRARDPRRARHGADALRSQTSGNCIRNVTTDHFAGIAPDEIVDSFVWCEIIRQWSSFHPEFSFLPRKFKIAVNGAAADRAAHIRARHRPARAEERGRAKSASG